MKKLFFTLALASLVQVASAGSGIWGSFAQFTVNGGGAQWFDMGYASALADFNSYNFGTFDLSLGNTLVLSGGEINTYKNGADDITGANLYWRVWSGTPGGSFTTDALGFTADQPFNNAAGDATANAGDQKWAQLASTPDVLQGLTPGSYTLEIYYDAPFSISGVPQTPHYANNGGANFQATFQVVPEPTSLALAGLGMLTWLAGRRAKKV